MKLKLFLLHEGSFGIKIKSKALNSNKSINEDEFKF